MRKRFDRDHEGIFTMINTLHHQLAVSCRRSLHAAAIRSVRCSPRSGGCVSASRSGDGDNQSQPSVEPLGQATGDITARLCTMVRNTDHVKFKARCEALVKFGAPSLLRRLLERLIVEVRFVGCLCARICAVVAVTAPPHPWFGQQRTAAEEAPLPQYFTVNDSIVNDCLVVLRELCYTYPALSEGVCGADSTSLWPRPAARHLGSPTVAGCVWLCVAEFVSTLFQHLPRPNTFECALSLIEEILAVRTETFDVSLVGACSVGCACVRDVHGWATGRVAVDGVSRVVAGDRQPREHPVGFAAHAPGCHLPCSGAAGVRA